MSTTIERIEAKTGLLAPVAPVAPAIRKPNVGDVLERAAELIERDGWCQGAYVDDHGRRCLSQALGDAADDLGSSRGQAHQTVRWLMDNALPRVSEGNALLNFNDAYPEEHGEQRFAWEVVSVLRHGARRWYAEHPGK